MTLVAAAAWMLSNESPLEGNITASATGVAQARYVAEAGLNHTLAQITQAGCGPYTDITAEPFGNHSYSSTITTNNVGGTLATVSVPVTDDAYIDENQPTDNYGSDAKLNVYKKWFASEDQRALYRFDVENSGIAPGAVVVSAVMKVFVVTPDPQYSVSVNRVTANWDEASVTWDSINSDYDWSSGASIPSNPPAGQYVDVNITSLAQGWINGAYANQGVMLLPHLLSDNDLSEYTSKEYGTISQRPVLEITVSDGSLSDRATVTATGMLAGGASHSLTRDDLPLYQAIPSNLVLQPGAARGKDAWLTSTQTGWNYGAQAAISVNSSSQRGLVEFNLDSLPPGVRIDSAVLSLYRNNATGAGTVSVYPVTAAWAEGTCAGPGCTADGATWDTRDGTTTWSSPGGDFDGTALDSQPIAAATGWYSWDVTRAASAWTTGTLLNNGLLLIGSDGFSGAFNSSDHADATLHPYLTITFSCECGVTCQLPQGSGNVLLVVGDAAIPVEADIKKQSLFEAWGYAVNLIDDDADQPTFDGSLAASDVAYVSETSVSSTVGTRLSATDKGVVNEDTGLLDELGLSSSGSRTVTGYIEIVDNSHFITALFPSVLLPVYQAPMEGLLVTGTPAPALQVLGNQAGTASLALVDSGGVMSGGGTAPGRRVTVPVGTVDRFNWDYLNNNGRLIVQRAIQWGTGNTGGACVAGNFRDEFAAAAFSNSDGSLSWAGDWIEVDTGGTGASTGLVRITGGELAMSGGTMMSQASLAREMDLSGHLSATLTFDYSTGSGVEPGEDSVVVEVSGNGGASWTVLEDFVNEPASASGSRSYDISGYLAADTQVRFRINAAYGGPGEYFYVDNLEIAAGCTPPPPPAGDKLLLVVVNPASLLVQEAAKKALIESWGYTVSLIDEADNQAAFDAAVAANDVVYITEDVASGTVGTKLVNATIGVLTEEANLSDEFGFSDGIAWGSGVEIQIDDNTHYITQPFAGGNLTIFTASESLAYLTPSLAPDAALLGRVAGGLSLTAVDAGANVIAGRTAAGRRVLLPWGGNDFDVNNLNADGKTIMQRAIEWGVGASGGGGGGGGGGCDGTFRDEFILRQYDQNNGTLNWATDWGETGEMTSATGGDIMIDNDTSNYQLQVRDDGQTVWREADLSAAGSATLSFDYRRENLSGSGDYVAVEVSYNGGSSWSELARFTGTADDASYASVSYPLDAGQLSATTRIRFLTPTSGMANSNMVWFDNVEIQCAP